MSIDNKLQQIIQIVVGEIYNKQGSEDCNLYFNDCIKKIDGIKQFITNAYENTPKQNNPINNFLNNIITITYDEKDRIKIKDIYKEFKIANPDTKIKFGRFKSYINVNSEYNEYYFVNSSKCCMLKKVKLVNQNQ